MGEHTPQYIQAMSAARSLAKITGETVITYYDLTGISPNDLQICTESEWDIMQDNGIVESSWVSGWIYPEDAQKKQNRDGTLHDRLLSLGWTHTYRAPRYDYYSKRDWTVRVPTSTLSDPVYSRRTK